MDNHSKVSSSAKFRLRENLVLQLMECLIPSVSFDIFMDNYFASFRLLTHHGVNKIRATRVLNKIGHANALLSLGINSCKKRNVATLNRAYQANKQCNFDSVAQNDIIPTYIASSKSRKPKRFVRYWSKVEKIYIQLQKLNQFHCYNQDMGFVNRMDQNMAKYWYPNEKIVVEWQILLFRVLGYCIVSTKIKAMSLCLLQLFEEIFSEIFKGRQIILEPFRNLKYPIRCLL